jgi:hypothetical protein
MIRAHNGIPQVDTASKIAHILAMMPVMIRSPRHQRQYPRRTERKLEPTMTLTTYEYLPHLPKHQHKAMRIPTQHHKRYRRRYLLLTNPLPTPPTRSPPDACTQPQVKTRTRTRDGSCETCTKNLYRVIACVPKRKKKSSIAITIISCTNTYKGDGNYVNLVFVPPNLIEA